MAGKGEWEWLVGERERKQRRTGREEAEETSVEQTGGRRRTWSQFLVWRSEESPRGSERRVRGTVEVDFISNIHYIKGT